MEPGTYHVRVKGAGTVLAGDSLSVTILPYVAPPLDVTPISRAIDAAENAKQGISINENDPSAVSNGTRFVRQEVWNTLNATISAATDAMDVVETDREVQDAVDALNAAIAAFEDAVQIGTYVVPSSGGSFSNTETTTDKNPDGSTTKTETNRITGAVTKTTTYPNGDKTVVKSMKDGTVTEIVDRKDGYRSETVTKPDGAFTSKVTDTAGVKTETTGSATGETTARVTLPKDAKSATVTVPAQKSTPGTVAVLVKPDGTEEIIKTSVMTTDGMRFTVTGNANVKIVDNSNRFTDVAENDWAAEAVQFVASRELFQGTGKEQFDLNGNMTRSMLVTVLARLDGQDTTGGETWYAKATNWAKGQGISDGLKPDGLITREQIAVMLYRYAGQPETTGEGRKFPDANQVSGWAKDAMDWAVETGILSGNDRGEVNPTGVALRCEVATMLQRFISR